MSKRIYNMPGLPQLNRGQHSGLYRLVGGIAAVSLSFTLSAYVTKEHSNLTDPTPSSTQSQPVASPAETLFEIENNSDLSDQSKKTTASQIISTFENSTTEIQYKYAEDIGDGRGITAGRAGFTSETGDLLMVVQRYTEKSPNNKLAKYLPSLETANQTDVVETIEGFIETWNNISDTDFIKAQDEIFDELYFNPAMERANSAGVTTAVGQLIILDTIIQHGEGEDPDGLPAILNEAITKLGIVDNNEVAWLAAFLNIRQKHLENAHDPATRQGWLDSVDRVKALRSILETGNINLNPPIDWTVYGDHFELVA